mgnify:FL=1
MRQKLLVLLLAAMFVFVGCGPSDNKNGNDNGNGNGEQEEMELSIVDPRLEAAIRIELNKLEGELTVNDLGGLETLLAPESGIECLLGLEAAVNLNYVDFTNNEIVDVEVLGKIPSLTHIVLSGNKIKDISALNLKNLPDLYLLDVTGNKLDWDNPALRSHVEELRREGVTVNK